MKQMSGEEHSWRETAHAKALRQHQAWGTPKGKDVSGEQSQSRAEQRVKGRSQGAMQTLFGRLDSILSVTESPLSRAGQGLTVSVSYK